MTDQPLGYVDELVRVLESGKKIFRMIGSCHEEFAAYVKPDKQNLGG